MLEEPSILELNLERNQKALSKFRKKKVSTFEEFYKEKQKLAKDLEKKYNKKLTKKVNGKPIKTTITMGSLTAEKKDNDLDMKIKIAPNDASGDISVPFSDDDFDSATGQIYLYRGVHLQPKWNQDKTLIEKLKAGKDEFAPAAKEISGKASPTNDDLEKAAIQIKDELKEHGYPTNIKRFWAPSGNSVPSTLAALFSLFVENHEKFLSELKGKENFKDLKFTEAPFLSTTKEPNIAATYALKTKKKVLDSIPSYSSKNTVWVSGKVFIYKFSLNELNQEKAIDVQKSAAAKTIVISKRKFDQKEVAFTGSIPGKNRIHVVNADAKESQTSLKSAIIEKSPNPRKWKQISQK